jgi:hypothetical protein
MEELPKKEEQVEQVGEEPTIEQPKQIAFLKKQWKKYQNLTAKSVEDNLWIIGMKFFLKGIMVLILILMSPFILVILMFTLLAAG